MSPPAARARPNGKMDPVSFSVVGLGGSVEGRSQSDLALRAVLAALDRRGATTTAFSGAQLDFPPYHIGAELPDAALAYVAAVRAADAVVISSPGYHGTVSGLVKNALDYLEELRTDDRPYLQDRPVGLIAVARGWQAAVSTLATLRQITHALRGWPSPFGLTVNSAVTTFDPELRPDSPQIADSVEVLADQLASWPGFAR